MNIAHPWHGIPLGEEFPEILNAYIELTPFDTVKYELDKDSGILKIDRPQKYSNLCPALYGFVPRTYCGKSIGKHCSERTSIANIQGDGDPIDICVLSERPIQHHNILLKCIPIGGFRMIDKDEADDKIIAVLKNDPVYGNITDIKNIPDEIIQRLLHYFQTYKLSPGSKVNSVNITEVYGAYECQQILQLAAQDYLDEIAIGK